MTAKSMKQIVLPFDELRPDKVDDCLIITNANSAAFSALGNSSAWPGHCAILVGPARSGKSLLARYFESQGGLAFDDADALDDETLFHKWNEARGKDLSLLLVSAHMPADWNISLPDLKSRLATAQIILLDQPDDELAEQLMLKLFRDRGTSIGIDALAYALRRIERSYAGIEAFVRRANQFSLSEGGALTLPRVKRLLETER